MGHGVITTRTSYLVPQHPNSLKRLPTLEAYPRVDCQMREDDRGEHDARDQSCMEVEREDGRDAEGDQGDVDLPDGGPSASDPVTSAVRARLHYASAGRQARKAGSRRPKRVARAQ